MERITHKIDATGRIAGRLASEIAVLLQGKNKPSYNPSVDCGDRVEVSNVQKIRFSGNKINSKIYYRHTRYPGGIRTKKLSDLIKDNPAEVLRKIIYNMLPKNKLRSKMLKRLIIS
ncbi:MAG: 50S ribosomal protein L13 [Candidatus Komeilibacteria bacterium CG11_big_fil_rev_8_21_14_0_20_36_20]|uniref:Large ribosomal subunit protein uL13 n=1 Tax=Candidatus Komeilibacteria bacterium CG11_big_fil_rev_8_21_14_0_20_36_20 TaxID=1974477 RepID=A0A2H0NBZ4_9BACT|nr:MAG: 50S ribosomal protein L13 [Candidatus Komeilibacteria bacterium CG11_big_fil_rev_8_21_14_0_20_36_20]PIR81993.1 MAG: 50S ribosomal protein L13 [Candidatus Komeilibacteria bacterium CG10_big_fil_rev_8_21_14_0_10_36_65]PJC55531.1 MAG: 50S ribosomal protein L13 [Candidatus Komeilibacteria bacterium CG_4_9_14_0_2_um_filter_36_13]